MCGICGIYDSQGVNRNDLQAMMNRLRHRGPDDSGTHVNHKIALGSTRLSIIDINGGHMPISNEKGTIYIVFNGEIYNYRILRIELEKRGHQFKSQSDTEVILHLYEDLGEDCVKWLKGMFALAIWDEEKDRLFIARDRIGQKPLFYALIGQTLIFASEVKALLTHRLIDRQINMASIYHYLSLRFIPSPDTMFSQIQKLPPAHYLIYQQGQLKISRYWEIDFTKKQKLSESDIIENLENLLKNTIESHLISDVPVGAFLSGGLDSSIIVSMMAGKDKKTPSTFSIGTEEQSFNELPYARMVADHCRTNHYDQCVHAGLISRLPEMIWHLDEPSDPIAACMFHAAGLAAKHVKVVLGGDGGDELFGGFDRYLGINRLQMLNRFTVGIPRKLIKAYLAFGSEDYSYKSLGQKLRWFAMVSGKKHPAYQYADATIFFRFGHDQKRQLFGQPFYRELAHLDSAHIITEPFETGSAESLTDKMIYSDLVTRLPEHTLMLTDRMTMAHGLEARSPFLDHELVEFMASVPAGLKIKGNTLKYILRRIAARHLPKKIVKRKKQGFMFPIAFWFRNEWYGFLKPFLLSSRLVKEGILQPHIINQLLEEHRANKVDHHVRLWMLLNLDLWYQIYIENLSYELLIDNIQSYRSKGMSG